MIATLAYRHFDGTLPSYLSASLCTYQTSSTLRSSNEKLWKILKRNLKSVGDSSFSFIAQLSGIRCLPACGISPPSLTSNPSSILSFINRHFHKFRRTIMCMCVERGKLCLCLCIFAWMLCASALRFFVVVVVVLREDLRCTRAVYYHYYLKEAGSFSFLFPAQDNHALTVCFESIFQSVALWGVRRSTWGTTRQECHIPRFRYYSALEYFKAYLRDY